MNDHPGTPTPPDPRQDPRVGQNPRLPDELERRLRTALRSDAARARVSPDAWTKVHRRLRTGRSPWWAGLRAGRTFLLGLATATAAVATFGVLIGPHLIRPPSVAGPLPAESAGPAETAGPTGTALPPGPARKQQPTLAVATAGDDLRVRLELVYAREYADGATVRLRPYRWRDGAWTPLGSDPAVVGRAGGWPVDASRRPGVCELTVVNTQGGVAAGREPSGPRVRVRLAPEEGAQCSQAYDFEWAGERLITR
ncbi:MAG: hypothetical protein ACRDUA_01735 [Micromonosporaceae bacterium]